MNEKWLCLKSGTDIRGDAIERPEHPAVLTPEIARAIGGAFIAWLRREGVEKTEPVIAVGRDSRLSGPALCAALIEGLTAAGARVLDCGLCTTLAMFMTTITEGFSCDGAVMCTASHHPWYRNGFKFFTAQGGLVGKDIEWMIRNAQTPRGEAREAEKVDFLSIYAAQLAQRMRKGLGTQAEKPLMGLHIAVDAGNGAGGFYARLLKSLGADVSGSRYLEPDGRFPNHIPNPENEEAMASICAAVKESGADMGVIFDTDCDRAAVVDCRGEEINRNRLIALITRILLEETPGVTVVTDSVTSSGLKDFITAHGGAHHRFKRGYRNVIDEAQRLCAQGIDCPLAIETSGHAAMRENHFLDDGMYLATRLIIEEMRLKAQGRHLGDLISGLREPVEAREIRLNITAKDFRAAGQKAITAFEEAAMADRRAKIATDNREGMRVSYTLDGQMDAGWVLMRLSVHDPVLPINAEADISGALAPMLRALYEAIEGSEGIDIAPLREIVAKM